MDDLFTQPAILVPLAVIGFALWWCVVSFLIAHLSGWASLARVYRAWAPFTGRTWRGQSGYLRWSSYKSCLNVGCDERGLSLSVVFLFRVGHPPLFIPWEDVSLKETRFLFFDYAELSFRKARPRLQIRPRLAERLRAQAGPRWPAPSGPV